MSILNSIGTGTGVDASKTVATALSIGTAGACMARAAIAVDIAPFSASFLGGIAAYLLDRQCSVEPSEQGHPASFNIDRYLNRFTESVRTIAAYTYFVHGFLSSETICDFISDGYANISSWPSVTALLRMLLRMGSESYAWISDPHQALIEQTFSYLKFLVSFGLENPLKSAVILFVALMFIKAICSMLIKLVRGESHQANQTEKKPASVQAEDPLLLRMIQGLSKGLLILGIFRLLSIPEVLITLVVQELSNLRFFIFTLSTLNLLFFLC